MCAFLFLCCWEIRWEGKSHYPCSHFMLFYVSQIQMLLIALYRKIENAYALLIKVWVGNFPSTPMSPKEKVLPLELSLVDIVNSMYNRKILDGALFCLLRADFSFAWYLLFSGPGTNAHLSPFISSNFFFFFTIYILSHNCHKYNMKKSEGRNEIISSSSLLPTSRWSLALF